MCINMRKSVILLGLALLVVAFSRVAMATTFTNMHMEAELGTALSAVETAHLYFGHFVRLNQTATQDMIFTLSGTTAPTTDVTLNGSPALPADYTIITSGTPGRIAITGEVNKHVSLTSFTPTTLSNGAGGTMNVTLGLQGSSDVALGATGTGTAYIGGTVAVKQNQANGMYTGTYTVNVAYID